MERGYQQLVCGYPNSKIRATKTCCFYGTKFCGLNIKNLKTLKNDIFKKKKLDLSIVYSKCGHEYKKIFKEEDSIQILKILSLITNIEEYQELYHHAWRKHKSRI